MADRTHNPLAFPDELQKLADLITEERTRVERQMHTPGCDRETRGKVEGKCCIAAVESNAATRRALVELTQAYTTLGKEIRMWGDYKATQLDKMSPAKKADVLIRFFQSLPLSARLDIYATLAAEESRRPGGIKLAYDNSFGGSPPAKTASGDE